MSPWRMQAQIERAKSKGSRRHGGNENHRAIAEKSDVDYSRPGAKPPETPTHAEDERSERKGGVDFAAAGPIDGLSAPVDAPAAREREGRQSQGYRLAHHESERGIPSRPPNPERPEPYSA